MPQTRNNPKEREDRAEKYRNAVLVYKITGTAYRIYLSILRRPSPLSLGGVSHWFAALVSLILMVIITILTLLVGGTAVLQETFLVVIALGVVFFLTLRQAEMVGRRVIDTLLIKMKPPVYDEQVWDAISKNIKGQGLVATAIALACIPPEIVILNQLLAHPSAIWPIVGLLSVEIWVLSSSAYMGIFSSRRFVDSFRADKGDDKDDDKYIDLNLYKFDPARSSILQPIMGLFAGVMFDQAILGVAIVMSFFIVKPTDVTATIGTAILVLIVLMLIGNFIYAQLKIGALISQTKRKTVEELQKEIQRIYDQSFSGDDQTAKKSDRDDKELSRFLTLYEKVIKTSNFAIDVETITTYLSGMIWPLVSILTVNLPIPRHLIDNISQLLGEFSQLFVQLIGSGF
jgi:hypothetical protein